ncbi:MAG: hypothetical protein KGZ25_04700 [Planctomycetes bacterium]|nr:hypothetical protein [Planctomycetota bacterium]
MNIGDSINLQPVARVLQHHFPRSKVDYVYGQTTARLIEQNPFIENNYPIFQGAFVPSPEECQRIRDILASRSYAAVFSFCPFLPDRHLRSAGYPVVNPTSVILDIITKSRRRSVETAHLIPNIARYIDELMGAFSDQTLSYPHQQNGPRTRLYFPEDVLALRDSWLAENELSADARPVFLNPDASNRYTLLDASVQIDLLGKILSSDLCTHLLLGPGFTFPSVEDKVINSLPTRLTQKIRRLPEDITIELYGALLDRCRVFITGDTGPMHLAAARKICLQNEDAFRNRTAVVGLFGPTQPRIYGYDSSRAGFIPANQDAPSRVFEARCGRKNLLCSLERITQRCGGDECFREFDVEAVAQFTLQCLS